ncbi:MAG: hypothetical protein BroJett011_40710 [Chloroflexota bacterium]|nr:MAG: hypothetical protein BroJett011_40710 [Chloroflexota bacterium]
MTQTDLTIIQPMTETEARVLIEEIKTDISAVGAKLLELHEREGWKALGYSSWRECVMQEFDFQSSHVYRLLDFAKIQRVLSPIGENGYPLPAAESVARPLAALPDPEQQREAWQQAVDTAPGGKVTAKHVENVVSSMRNGHNAGNLIVDDARSSRQGIKLRCRWAYCTGGGTYTVPLDTMTCTKCGAVHVNGQVGHHLAPGEAERLEQQRLAVLAVSGQVVAVPNTHASEEPGEFTCPRCGQRQVKLNGGAMCLNEDCGAVWTTRTAYSDELDRKALEEAAQRAELKSQAVQLINRLPTDILPVLANLLADMQNTYLATAEADAAIPGL